MATVKASTVINAPPDRVFAYVTEPATMSEWLAKMVEYSVPIPVLGKIAEHIAVRRDARDLETSLTNLKEMLES